MNYSIRPEEHELREARKTVQGALETCKAVMDKKEDLEVCLGGKSRENYEERGAFGEAWNESLIRLYFNSDHGEDWKEDLKKITYFTYGESLFYEKSEEIQFDWQRILSKAFALQFMEKCGIKEDIDRENAEENWQNRDEENFTPGWDLCHLIGQELLEEHEFEGLPELKRSDILEAGDALFS
jgi:hypothetical protein